jgi:hypothetical protein
VRIAPLAACAMAIRVLEERRATTVATRVATATRSPWPPGSVATVSSPATMPTKTPDTRRTAFKPRSPMGALSAMNAAIGAKNGAEPCRRCVAMSHATVAAATPCTCGQTAAARSRSPLDMEQELASEAPAGARRDDRQPRGWSRRSLGEIGTFTPRLRPTSRTATHTKAPSAGNTGLLLPAFWAMTRIAAPSSAGTA